jgi:Holliday junction resolvasome RuvABC endonuclease subunit
VSAILALDIGTQMGFALKREDRRVYSGMEEFAVSKKCDDGQRWANFWAWLSRMKQENPTLDTIAYEHVVFIGVDAETGKAHSSSWPQIYGGFSALIRMFCAMHRMEYSTHNTSTVKKLFAGHGNASKDDMIAQCVAMGYKPQSPDEADAIAVLHVATNTCELLTPTGTTKGKPKPERKKRTAAPATGEEDPF